MNKVILILVFISFTACFQLPHNITQSQRPVIAIIDLPVQILLIQKGLASEGDRFLPAEYVRFFEMAGARTLIVPYDLSFQEKIKYFRNANGLFLPGGFQQRISMKEKLKIFSWVKNRNRKGQFYPLLGICLGFEGILQMSSKKYKIMRHLKNKDQESHKIILLNKQQSFIFKNMPQVLTQFAEQMHGVYFTHWKFISRIHFQQNLQLNQEFFITSQTVVDGQHIVSSFEGRRFPIISMQFHPEKPIFQWKKHLDKEALLHNGLSVRFGQNVANKMVELARYNKRIITQEFAAQLLEMRNQTVYHIPQLEYTGMYIFRKEHQKLHKKIQN